jgi:SAM-dependent methyltransferase
MHRVQTSYDQLPYEGQSYPQAHPNRLATVATLLGLSPQPVADCRVLELGCASGGHLLPLAVALPGSQFLGIDLSARQVEQGQEVIDALHLDNVELQVRDIRALDDCPGRFHYIVCHGAYSWVPDQVRERILEVCARNLAANGVAFVSYNTYPGWHLRGPVRDLLLYHTRQAGEPHARVQEARQLLELLAEAIEGRDGPYDRLLQADLQRLARCGDSYLFHEHLEEVNEPIYFHEFAGRAAAWGLRYLGEAELGTMLLRGYPPRVEAALRRMAPDLAQMEQYLDFLHNRTFRQTLLCHQATEPNYRLSAERLRGLYVASPARPLSASPDIGSTADEAFSGPGGTAVRSADPLAKTALLYLADIWPRAVSFEELVSAARARLGEGGTSADEDARVVGQCLLTCYLTGPDGLVYLWTQPPPFAAEPGERPLASPLARLQAAQAGAATNLRHETRTLDDFSRAVLSCLDGRDRDTLLRDLAKRDGPCGNPAEPSEALNQALDEALSRLAADAFLLGSVPPEPRAAQSRPLRHPRRVGFRTIAKRRTSSREHGGDQASE